VSGLTQIGVKLMLGAVFAGRALLMAREQEQTLAREEKQRVELLHDMDLKELYLQINHESFDDQLPGDVPVTWANIVNTADCNGCGGMTSYPDFKPKIQIDLQMCHVEVYSVEGYKVVDRNWEPHGAPWQSCMTRFQ